MIVVKKDCYFETIYDNGELLITKLYFCNKKRYIYFTWKLTRKRRTH